MKTIHIFLFAFLHFFSNAQNSCGIHGNVKDAATQEGIPFCLIVVYDSGFISSKSTTTNWDGDFKIDSLTPGNYFVIVRYVGYTSDTTSIHLEKDQSKFDIIDLKSAYTFGLNDQPITYKEPLIDPQTTNQPITREEFEKMKSAPIDTIKIDVHGSKVDTTFTLSILEERKLRPASPSSGIPSRMEYSELKGKITSSIDTEGIFTAVVFCANHHEIGVITDFDGNYRLRGLNPGKCLIGVKGLECQERIIPVFLKSGETTTMNTELCCKEIVLEELAPVVTEENSNPVPENFSPISNDTSNVANDTLNEHVYFIYNAHRNGNFANYYFLKHGTLNQFDDSTFYFDCNDNGCVHSVLYVKKGNRYFKSKDFTGDGPASFTIRKKKKSLKLKCKGAHAKLHLAR
jgi:hypothetical protein